MAFNGYFVKIKEVWEGQGDYVFPNEYIEFDTPVPLNGVLNMDAYRDEEGVLHQNVLQHRVPKIEFQLRPMTNHEFDTIMGNIQARYVNSDERKVVAQVFLTEFGGYTDFIEMYMPDPETKVKSIIDEHTLQYNSQRFALIGC